MDRVVKKFINITESIETGTEISNNYSKVDDDIAYAKIIKNMIIDTEKAMSKVFFNSDTMNIKEQFDILSKVMYNASLIDIDDIKVLTNKEVDHYYDVLGYCYDLFEKIMRLTRSNIITLKWKTYPITCEEYNKLSKEELLDLIIEKL